MRLCDQRLFLFREGVVKLLIEPGSHSGRIPCTREYMISCFSECLLYHRLFAQKRIACLCFGYHIPPDITEYNDIAHRCIRQFHRILRSFAMRGTAAGYKKSKAKHSSSRDCEPLFFHFHSPYQIAIAYAQYYMIRSPKVWPAKIVQTILTASA